MTKKERAEQLKKEEMLKQLKHDRALCNFNPSTGEGEPIDKDCRKSAEALDYAINLIENIEKEREAWREGGYSDGYSDGYERGWDDGYEEGWG